MERRNRWWVVLISLGMVAYGGAASWSLLFLRSRWESRPDQLLLAVLIAVVGACALVMEIKYQPQERPPSFLWKAIDPYLAAWSKLWRTKWLLWIYGTIVAASITSSVLGDIIGSWLRGGEVKPIRSDVEHFSFVQQLLRNLWGALPDWLGRVSTKFFPTIGRMPLGPVLVIVAIALALSLVPALKRLRSTTEYSRRVGFFSVCLAIFVLGCLFSGARYVIQTREYRAMMNPPAVKRTIPGSPGSARISPPSGTFGGRRVQSSRLSFSIPPRPGLWQMLLSMFVDVPLSTILGAVMVGGILGSLLREKNGGAVSKSTFTEDAVRSFQPLAGLILICVVPGILGLVTLIPLPRVYDYLLWPLGILLAPALMFAPFAVVVQKANCWEAVMQSLRLWKKMWRGTICLIAAGAFFYALVYGPAEALWQAAVIARFSVLLPIMFSLIGVIGEALILLAVWEFYQANAIDRESSAVPESDPLP